MILLFVFLFFFGFSTNPAAYDFGQLEIVSDLLPEDCFQQGMDYAAASEDDGLPKCKKFDVSVTECAKFYFERSTQHVKAVSKPTCAKDGQFGPVQCKGERPTGRCFCYSSAGNRIFGQEWWKKADNMTCACSRKKVDMEGSLYFNSLHCNSMGNYEPLQCDVVSQQCWCTDELTGKLKSPVVPSKAMVKLPCYKSLTVGTQYLRQCESQKYAQERISYQLKLHGTIGVSFGVLLCDDDGSYGAYKVVDGSAYCTWRDNTNLGTWQYADDDRSSLNCNCARDTKIFSNAGKTQTQKCSGSGNYRALQTEGTLLYCVDKDGFRKTRKEDTPKTEEDCALYASY